MTLEYDVSSLHYDTKTETLYATGYDGTVNTVTLLDASTDTVTLNTIYLHPHGTSEVLFMSDINGDSGMVVTSIVNDSGAFLIEVIEHSGSIASSCSLITDQFAVSTVYRYGVPCKGIPNAVCGLCSHVYTGTGVVDSIDSVSCTYTVNDNETLTVAGITFTAFDLVSGDNITVWDGDDVCARAGNCTLLAYGIGSELNGVTVISYTGHLTVYFETVMVDPPTTSTFSFTYDTGCHGIWNVYTVSHTYLTSTGGQTVLITGEFHLPCTANSLQCRFGEASVHGTFTNSSMITCDPSPPWSDVLIGGTPSPTVWHASSTLELFGDDIVTPSIPVVIIALPYIPINAQPSPFVVSPGTVYFTLYANHLADNVTCLTNISDVLTPVEITFHNATMAVCRVIVTTNDLYLVLSNDYAIDGAETFYVTYGELVQSVPLPS